MATLSAAVGDRIDEHPGSFRPAPRAPLAPTRLSAALLDPSLEDEDAGLSDGAPPAAAAVRLTTLTRELRRLRRRKTTLEPLAWAMEDSRSPRIARARLRIVRRRLVAVTRLRADALTDVN